MHSSWTAFGPFGNDPSETDVRFKKKFDLQNFSVSINAYDINRSIKRKNIINYCFRKIFIRASG